MGVEGSVPRHYTGTGKFFEHGRAPSTQEEFKIAAEKCIDGGAHSQAQLFIELIIEKDVRDRLMRELETHQSLPTEKIRFKKSA